MLKARPTGRALRPSPTTPSDARLFQQGHEELRTDRERDPAKILVVCDTYFHTKECVCVTATLWFTTHWCIRQILKLGEQSPDP